MSNDRAENIDEVARDETYFDLYHQLESQNISRYEEQARELIKKKTLVLKVDNCWIKYSLDRQGCSSHIFQDIENTISAKSWIRLGWSRRKKERGLPSFFAKTETDVKFGLGN
jgi:hypothetical protein